MFFTFEQSVLYVKKTSDVKHRTFRRTARIRAIKNKAEIFDNMSDSSRRRPDPQALVFLPQGRYDIDFLLSKLGWTMQEQVHQGQAPIKRTKVKIKTTPQDEPPAEIVEQRDLAALWAVGILVSLLLALTGSFWNPPRYEARQSTSLDPTEARVENSQNQLVADALNKGEIEYHYSMEKLVKTQPIHIEYMITMIRLLLFPCGPIVIIGLLLRKTVRQLRRPKSS